MATAVRGQGSAYDVRPSTESPFGGPVSGIMGFFKDTAQGACSGLLSLLGATHMMGAPTALAPANGFQSFHGILERLASGGLAGPAELAGAVVLFLTARRTIARTLGVLLFIGFMAGSANGYTFSEMLTTLSDLLKGAAGVLDSIPQSEGA